MKKIFVMGAGRSATDLIEYLLQHAEAESWEVTVGDMSLELAQEKVGNHPRGKAVFFDGSKEEMRMNAVQNADVVVSLLPPFMHIEVAKVCLEHQTHLVTASYISNEMKALDEAAKAANLIFLNELGADPGIDHLNIMQGIDAIHQKGGEVLEVYSYCGSLVAPESNDNPWGYKFTWSPMNVILAGQASACYLRNGLRRFIPYNRIFSTLDTVEMGEMGSFEAYPNRDSYYYIEMYNLPHVRTMLRGTLRSKGFCEGWNALVKLGLTANEYRIRDSVKMTYRDWVKCYVVQNESEIIETAVASFLGIAEDSELMERLKSLGIFESTRIEKENATSAEILLDLLMKKWVFREGDKDMLVMVDKLIYQWEGKKYQKTATMAVIGTDHEHTAISKTVGLPAAMGVKLILQNKITKRGVIAPIYEEIYAPLLAELAENGVSFQEVTEEI
ncbi:MAG: saccharopine dehydrogenase C-terminal domain-containing protein [Bacteroidia bacterium]